MATQAGRLGSAPASKEPPMRSWPQRMRVQSGIQPHALIVCLLLARCCAASADVDRSRQLMEQGSASLYPSPPDTPPYPSPGPGHKGTQPSNAGGDTGSPSLPPHSSTQLPVLEAVNSQKDIGAALGPPTFPELKANRVLPPPQSVEGGGKTIILPKPQYEASSGGSSLKVTLLVTLASCTSLVVAAAGVLWCIQRSRHGKPNPAAPPPPMNAVLVHSQHSLALAWPSSGLQQPSPGCTHQPEASMMQADGFASANIPSRNLAMSKDETAWVSEHSKAQKSLTFSRGHTAAGLPRAVSSGSCEGGSNQRDQAGGYGGRQTAQQPWQQGVPLQVQQESSGRPWGRDAAFQKDQCSSSTTSSSRVGQQVQVLRVHLNQYYQPPAQQRQEPRRQGGEDSNNQTVPSLQGMSSAPLSSLGFTELPSSEVPSSTTPPGSIAYDSLPSSTCAHFDRAG